MVINQFDPIYFTEPCGTCYKGFKSGSLHKGPKAPKTDPNIGLAALKEAQLGERSLDFAMNSYNNDKPNRDRINALAIQVQEGFLQDSNLSRQDAQEFRDYRKTVFEPLEKSIVNNANEYDTAGRREAEAAKGLADVTQGFDTIKQTRARDNERMGVNPNSGNAQSLQQQTDVQQAIAGADAMNKGRTRAEMTGTALKMDAASLGRNLPSNQNASMQLAGNAASSGLNAELVNSSNNRAGLGVVQAGFGDAMQGYNNQANILQNQYQGKVAAYNAAQSANSGAFSGLGSIAGAGLSVFGPKLKDGGEVEEMNEGHNENAGFTGTGLVEGPGTETSDSITAKLSDDEFVLNAGTQKMTKEQIIAAAKKVKSNGGLAVLEAINKAGLKYREVA